MRTSYRIGVDENGLGARLGPLLVTAVLAKVDERGERLLGKKRPKRFAAWVGDSKDLVSHHDVALGEAWARLLGGEDAETPHELFARLSLEGLSRLREPCPGHVHEQCWSTAGEGFVAEPELVEGVRGVRNQLRERGVELALARSSTLCTQRLNAERGRGKNRFVSDLHAMEELVLSLRKHAGADVTAVCGKVGGMADYCRFFGPLSGWLCAVVEQRRERSAYRFPGLGELSFVQDADAKDPLVMLASLVGKYLRELLMARVARHWVTALDGRDESLPSGYNDPVTARFVEASALLRAKRRVPDTCFERAKAADD